MTIWLPSLEQVLLIHQRLISKTGGSHGIRDIGLIESAIARGSASFTGIEAHPNLISKAAAICCSLTQNHGFVDGNKRIGVTTMLLIMQKNHVQLQFSQEDLVQLGLSLAQGIADISDVEAWIKVHIVE